MTRGLGDVAPVLVEVRRPGRSPVVMALEDYSDLGHRELDGTTVVMFARCSGCGERIELSGPMAVVAAVVRRDGATWRARPA